MSCRDPVLILSIFNLKLSTERRTEKYETDENFQNRP